MNASSIHMKSEIDVSNLQKSFCCVGMAACALLIIYIGAGCVTLDKVRILLEDGPKRLLVNLEIDMNTLSVKGQLHHHVNFKKTGQFFTSFDFAHYTLTVPLLNRTISSSGTAIYNSYDMEQMLMVEFEETQTRLTAEELSDLQELINRSGFDLLIIAKYQWHSKLARPLVFPWKFRHVKYFCRVAYRSYEMNNIKCRDM